LNGSLDWSWVWRWMMTDLTAAGRQRGVAERLSEPSGDFNENGSNNGFLPAVWR
jgi:hypothetical protein